MTPATIPKNDEFTIGWICMRQLELVAAREMFNEVYGKSPRTRVPHDENSYELGQIGRNKVVMAYAPNRDPSMDTARRISAQMKATFPSIRMGVMVTIGSGIPTASEDIRLGDVVVGTPDRNFNGLIGFRQLNVQEDKNRAELTDTPAFKDYPRLLVSAARALGADRSLGVQGKIPFYMNQAFEWYPDKKETYKYPGVSNDKYFSANDTHADNDTKHCGNCDQEKVIPRKARESTDPVAHRGTIASADRAVSDVGVRDFLQMRFGAKGIQVGAAGLGNDFPTLVILGVADYADSHSNGSWKCYAALTAAAYAKELLANVTSLPTGRVLC
ncbi:nucleoside phosphorylase domain-containing protein [Aspergillus undulatus]|uniref:nucleoside phosphorylase domain-containing protein n=1 Tax=Aspergillus undulatus TaxID=1810928 RepID=UPI003CCE07D6